MSLPSAYDIAKYWLSKSGIERFPGNNVDDIGEPSCFACGYYSEEWDNVKTSEERWKKAPLDKAHLVPQFLGGSDTPDNIVLLCGQCHQQAPDYADPKEMLQWMSRRTYYWNREWEIIFDELQALGVLQSEAIEVIVKNQKQVKLLSQTALKNVGIHFGKGLKPSTKALVIRDVFTQLLVIPEEESFITVNNG